MPLPFILGVVLGAGGVVLYNNRDKAKRLAKKGNRVVQEKLSQDIKDVKEEAQSAASDLDQKAEELAKKGEDLIEKAKEKTDKLIDSIEIEETISNDDKDHV